MAPNIYRITIYDGATYLGLRLVMPQVIFFFYGFGVLVYEASFPSMVEILVYAGNNFNIEVKVKLEGKPSICIVRDKC